MQETGWWREQRRQQEPSDHSAGLVPVWKESRIGRVSDSRAVPSSVQPDQWGVLEPKWTTGGISYLVGWGCLRDPLCLVTGWEQPTRIMTSAGM